MKFSTIKFLIWITMAIFSTQIEAEEVVYGQLGSTVTLPNDWKRLSKMSLRWSKFVNGNAQNVFTQMSSGGLQSISQEMKDRVSLSGNGVSLIIKNLKAEDFAVFKCDISVDGWPADTKEYRLYQITVSAAPALVLASQTLSLKCTVEKSGVSTQISWSAPQNQKIEGRRFESGDETLRVSNVSVRDHGDWKCRVAYDKFTAEASVSVKVVDLSPSPPQPLYPTLSFSTSSLRLPCSLHTSFDSSSLSSAGFKEGHWSFTPFPWDVAPGASGGPQKILVLPQGPRLQWRTVGGAVVNNTALETDSKCTNLSIVRKVERGGVYTCALDFEGGLTLSRTLRVEVLRIVSSQGNPVLEGRELNLTCTLGHPSLLQNLTVKWLAPRLSSLNPLPKPPHQPLLSISRVIEKDRGTWQCELRRGDQSLANATLTLKTERVPVNVWLLVSICGAAVVFILLLALIFLCLRRHRQRMFIRRRRKTKYCRCKHPQVKGFYRT